MAENPKPTKEELLSRVTAAKLPGTRRLRTPPPANMPGVQGNPPLPAGKVVGQRRPSSLTDLERQTLTAAGWDDSMPIPNNMAAVLEQVQKQRLAEVSVANLPLPVDPRTAPMKAPEAIPLAQVDATTKARLRNVLTSAVAAEQEAELRQQDDARMAALPNDFQIAMQMAEAGAAKAASSPEVIIDDEPSADDPPAFDPPPPPSPPKAAAPQAQAPEQPDLSPTGASASHPADCPHCGWNLALPDVPEPPYAKKIAFVHALLGQQPYTDEYELFGGQVVVCFRALTIEEIEVVYKQAYRDRETGRAVTELDFYERLNRYRLYLQLRSLRTTTDVTGFVHDLPDGYDAVTNPGAKTCWIGDPGKLGPVAPTADTALIQIEAELTRNVLRTEALFRVVNSACNQFNRTVSKLEALADNTDFWKQTEAQS